MKKLFVTAFLLLGPVQLSFCWNRTGHDAVAAIAERYLTPVAKERIEKYLGGHSIVYYASWMDYYRHYPEYAHTNYWHTAPVNSDNQYTDNLFMEPGNAIYGLEYAINNLKNYKNQPDSLVTVNLYYVIHIVGDMHCPVHVKYPDLNNYKVLMNGEGISYHTVWDGVVLDNNHQWSYTEWADQLDRFSADEKVEIMSGTPRDWFHETAVASRVIYDMAPAGTEIIQKDHRFLNNASVLADSQICKAGYRLAKVLNELFDN